MFSQDLVLDLHQNENLIRELWSVQKSIRQTPKAQGSHYLARPK